MTILLNMARMFSFPTVLFRINRTTIDIRHRTTFTIQHQRPTGPPNRVKRQRFPTRLLFRRNFQNQHFMTALVNSFRQCLTQTANRTDNTTARQTKRAGIMMVLALRPRRHTTTQVLQYTGTSLTISLPTIRTNRLLFMSIPLNQITITLSKFADTRAHTANRRNGGARGGGITRGRGLGRSLVQSNT